MHPSGWLLDHVMSDWNTNPTACSVDALICPLPLPSFSLWQNNVSSLVFSSHTPSCRHVNVKINICKKKWINSATQQVKHSPPWCPSRCQSWRICLAAWGTRAWESSSWPTLRQKQSTARSTWLPSAVWVSRQTLRSSSASKQSRNAGCSCSR